MQVRLCRNCFELVVSATNQRPKAYCSHECAEQTKNKRRCAARAPAPRPCEECGKVLRARRKHKRFCDFRCSKAYRHRTAPLPVCADPNCERVSVAAGLCGLHYQHRRKKVFALEGLTRAGTAPVVCKAACAECGVAWKSERPWQKFCSPRCQRKAWFRKRQHQRRLTHIGKSYAPVDVIAVLRRGKWRCNSCGCDTPQLLRGSVNPQAPEVDHVWPLSRGGPHAEWNMQVLCRACNGKKRNGLTPATEEFLRSLGMLNAA